MGKKIGYIIVSNNEEKEEVQIETLKKAGVDEKNIYIESSQGEHFIGSTSWNNLLENCARGDTLVISELQRLGKNFEGIKENFELIQNKGINLEILNMPLLTKGLANPPTDIWSIVLELLSYITKIKRKAIVKRQREGVVKENGKTIGKKTGNPIGRKNLFEDMTTNQRKAIESWMGKKSSLEECIKITKFSRSTIFRIKKIILNEGK